MTIEDLKRALVEVRGLCRQYHCAECPIQMEYCGDEYCPLMETEDGFDVHFPKDWAIDDWEDDGNDAVHP
jgi:hypothetical protein